MNKFLKNLITLLNLRNVNQSIRRYVKTIKHKQILHEMVNLQLRSKRRMLELKICQSGSRKKQMEKPNRVQG
jgi:hypothetical protein